MTNPSIHALYPSWSQQSHSSEPYWTVSDATLAPIITALSRNSSHLSLLRCCSSDHRQRVHPSSSRPDWAFLDRSLQLTVLIYLPLRPHSSWSVASSLALCHQGWSVIAKASSSGRSGLSATLTSQWTFSSYLRSCSWSLTSASPCAKCTLFALSALSARPWAAALQGSPPGSQGRPSACNTCQSSF